MSVGAAAPCVFPGCQSIRARLRPGGTSAVLRPRSDRRPAGFAIRYGNLSGGRCGGCGVAVRVVEVGHRQAAHGTGRLRTARRGAAHSTGRLRTAPAGCVASPGGCARHRQAAHGTGRLRTAPAGCVASPGGCAIPRIRRGRQYGDRVRLFFDVRCQVSESHILA